MQTKWRQTTTFGDISFQQKNNQRGGGVGIRREPGEHSVQVFELRPFIMRANRIVIMTRGKLNAQDLLCPADSTAANPRILTELIRTLTSSLSFLDGSRSFLCCILCMESYCCILGLFGISVATQIYAGF